MSENISRKKIYLRLEWDNREDENKFEDIIYDYKFSGFENFHLLNHNVIEDPESLEQLSEDLEKAIKVEDYEKAKTIQDKIDKLKK